jgi:hypothetical protein
MVIDFTKVQLTAATWETITGQTVTADISREALNTPPVQLAAPLGAVRIVFRAGDTDIGEMRFDPPLNVGDTVNLS